MAGLSGAGRILVVNPNSTAAVTEVIRQALAGLGDRFEFETLADGPPAIATWRDWHAVAEPLARLVEARDAAAEPPCAFLVACVSDPGIDLLRSLTPRPVIGALRSGIASALARGGRFGLVAFVRPSVQRQQRVMQAMGVEARCVGSLPLDLPMAALVDAQAPRARLLEVGTALRDRGADSVVLGCAGMAGHRRFLEDAIGLPVIEPIQAAAVQAMLACL